MVIFHTCHLILETIFDGQVSDPYMRAPISVNQSLSLQITAHEQEIPWKDIEIKFPRWNERVFTTMEREFTFFKVSV